MSLRALLLDRVLRRVITHSDEAGSVEAALQHRRRDGAPEPADVPAGVRKQLRVEERQVQGRPVVTLRARAANARRALVFLPGGGYAQPVSPSHWTAVARFVRRGGVDAVVPLYQVAPQGDAAAAHALVRSVLDEAITTYGPGNVHVMGDSAGAGLALGAVQRQPGGIRTLILLSPWIDVELTNPAIGALADWDVILRADELRAWGVVWAAGAATSDPEVSPVHGPMEGLPPVHIVTGGRDILLPDALELHRALTASGNLGSLSYAPDANHAIGLLGPATPEGARALHFVLRALRS